MKSLVLVTQVGISLSTPIILGALIGAFVDRWINTKFLFSIIFLVLGIAAGFLNTYKLIMAVNTQKKDDDSERE